MARPQMEALDALSKAAHMLAIAEDRFALPQTRDVQTEADDGSLRTISILEGQVATLAGQKTNLISKVSELETDKDLLERRLMVLSDEVEDLRRQKTEMLLHQDLLERRLMVLLDEVEDLRRQKSEMLLHQDLLERRLMVLLDEVEDLRRQKSEMLLHQDLLERRLMELSDEVEELRRQKTEMLLHQGNLSAELRNHLEAESKRADAGELALAELNATHKEMRTKSDALKDALHTASIELKALETALQERGGQVDTLRGLYLELRDAMSSLGLEINDVTSKGTEQMMEHLVAHGTGLQGAMGSGLVDTLRGLYLVLRDAMSSLGVEINDLTGKGSGQMMEHLAAHGTGLQEINDVTSKGSGQMLEHLVAHGTGLQDVLAQASAARQASVQAAQQAALLAQHQQHLTQHIAADRDQGHLALQDRRHKRTVKMLVTDLPDAVADNLAGDMEGLRNQLGEVAEDLALANAQLSVVNTGSGSMTHGGGPGPQYPDKWQVPNDESSEMLHRSQMLRSQLNALMAPGASPGIVVDALGTEGIAWTSPSKWAAAASPVKSQPAVDMANKSARQLYDGMVASRDGGAGEVASGTSPSDGKVQPLMHQQGPALPPKQQRCHPDHPSAPTVHPELVALPPFNPIATPPYLQGVSSHTTQYHPPTGASSPPARPAVAPTQYHAPVAASALYYTDTGATTAGSPPSQQKAVGESTDLGYYNAEYADAYPVITANSKGLRSQLAKLLGEKQFSSHVRGPRAAGASMGSNDIPRCQTGGVSGADQSLKMQALATRAANMSQVAYPAPVQEGHLAEQEVQLVVCPVLREGGEGLWPIGTHTEITDGGLPIGAATQRARSSLPPSNAPAPTVRRDIPDSSIRHDQDAKVEEGEMGLYAGDVWPPHVSNDFDGGLIAGQGHVASGRGNTRALPGFRRKGSGHA
eukprot:gene8306-1578_t